MVDTHAPMPTTILKGDLFETAGLKAFAQACSRDGTLDAGIAVAFRKRWPRMAEDCAQRCRDKRPALGDVFVWSDDDVVVYSLVTEELRAADPKSSGRSGGQMSALARAVRQMIALAQQGGVTRIGIPRIGAGPKGLDWKRVRSFLVEEGEKTPVELLVFEQFIRARPAPAPEG